MSLFIEKLDGTRYDLQKIGLQPLTFTIDSPSPRVISETVDGRDGHYDLGTTYDGRSMRASFAIKGKDYIDYLLARDEVFKLFASKTTFHLMDEKQPRKRWKVKVASKFTPDKVLRRWGTFEVEFISSSPFSESCGTTLDPLTFTAEKWQVGQGLTLEEPKYTHSTIVFNIYNAGDVTIDPRELPLKIIYRGASNNLKIKNTTTGDEWHYTKSSSANDNITLDGIRSTKNNLSIFSETNRKLITLAPGWNSFELSGISVSFLISFDFRFYYL